MPSKPMNWGTETDTNPPAVGSASELALEKLTAALAKGEFGALPKPGKWDDGVFPWDFSTPGAKDSAASSAERLKRLEQATAGLSGKPKGWTEKQWREFLDVLRAAGGPAHDEL